MAYSPSKMKASTNIPITPEGWSNPRSKQPSAALRQRRGTWRLDAALLIFCSSWRPVVKKSAGWRWHWWQWWSGF